MTEHRTGTAEACSGCSFFADHLDGPLVHLNHHDVTLLCASRAPLEKIDAATAAPTCSTAPGSC
jgi:predicted dithiol-disulfide oxidoreductase (DUF899 family)